MSKKKNLEWICGRCTKTLPEVKIEPSEAVLKECSFCGVGNWCFPVASSRQTNTTDTLVYDELTPAETVPEAESTEETEAVEEAVDEALEAVIEEAAEIEKEPDKTELEAETMGPSTETPEEPLEAEPEPITSTVGDLDELAEAQRLADIAELEAKLEALKE